MDNLSVNTADLEKLSEKDKSELQQFLQNESTKARLASCAFSVPSLPFPPLLLDPLSRPTCLFLLSSPSPTPRYSKRANVKASLTPSSPRGS